MKEHLVTYFNNKNHGSKFLILHPQTFDSSSIVAFLLAIKEFAGQSVVIVTSKSAQINTCLSQELPADLYVKYDDAADSSFIKSVIENKGFVFIDDYSEYQRNNFDDIFLSGESKIICLTNGTGTGGPSGANEWKLLTLNIFDEGPLLNYEVDVVDTERTEGTEGAKGTSVLNKCLIKCLSKHVIYGKDVGTLAPIVKSENIDNVVLIDEGSVQSVSSLTDIEYLHIIDLNLEIFIQLMKMYQRVNYNLSISTFNIRFYIDEKSDDVSKYEQVCTYIESYQSAYMNFVKNSCLIKFNQELGVYVEH